MKDGRIGVPKASLWYTRFSGSVCMIPLQVSSGVTYILLQGSLAHYCEEYITVAHISECISDRYAEDDSIERF